MVKHAVRIEAINFFYDLRVILEEYWIFNSHQADKILKNTSFSNMLANILLK